MSVVDTTRTVAPGRSGPPRAYAARLAARVVDGVVTAILAILVSWAVLSGPVGQALSSNGFTDYADFLSQWDWRDPLGGVGGLVVAEIRPMLVTAVFLQVLVAWVYETGFTTLSGSTPGKASRRLRVVIDEPVVLGPVHHRHGLVNRAVRMGARAALVVVPPSAAVGLSLASASACRTPGDMAEMAIAVTLLFFVLWLSGGRGVHGLVSGTTVGSFNWAQLRGEAERRAEQVATQRAPSLLRDVERVANQSSAGRAVTQELRRRGIDATHPEAAVAGVREVANRVQHEGVRSVADSAVRSAATSAAHTARARATTELGRVDRAARLSRDSDTGATGDVVGPHPWQDGPDGQLGARRGPFDDNLLGADRRQVGHRLDVCRLVLRPRRPPA